MKTTTGKAPNLSRRRFIVGSAAAAGGGLALGSQHSVRHRAGRGRAGRGGATPKINAWVVVKPDDTAVIRIVRAEMGQGTHTGLAQLVAEELECDWKKVDDRADHRRARTSRASARGATCRPAAAAASARRRTTSAAPAPQRA